MTISSSFNRLYAQDDTAAQRTMLDSAEYYLNRYKALSAQYKEISEKESTNKENKLVLRPRARVYFDGAAFLNNHQNYIGSGTAIGDVRLGLSGTCGRFEGLVDIGFAKDAISLKDIFVAYHFRHNSMIQLGHFPEPFGIDYMDSSSSVKFTDEGIVMQAFSPARNLGIMYTGWSKVFWGGIGAFSDNNLSGRLNRFGNDGYALTGRFVLNPFRTMGNILHAGVAATYRLPDNVAEPGDARSVSYGTTLGSMINSEEFVHVKVSDAKSTTKIAAELMGAYRNISFQGEYIYAATQRHQGLHTFKSNGFYAQIAYLAHGGDYKYDDAVARYAVPEPGSLEFAARWAHVDLNCPTAEIMGGVQNQLTVGCNYYWKSFLRMRLNYDMAHVRGLKTFNYFSARVMLLF